MVQMDQWNGFKGRLWKEEINVRDFQNNYKPYDGDESFLEGPTEATISFGADYRSYRRKKELRAAYLTWKQR